MSSFQGTSQKIAEIERLLADLKSEKAQDASKILPPNVGLIWLPHTTSNNGIQIPRNAWGDAQMQTAWMTCRSCKMLYHTVKSSDSRSGRNYETKDKCPNCNR
mmetsp:Transcript_6722/g.16819  ORF Transcript_6722/g.16819 Transcript_6722/m.16819 type:complete len:103 (-) Transcript_6722:54-362(-)